MINNNDLTVLEKFDPKIFSQEIEDIVRKGKDLRYVDAIIHYCQLKDIELESVPMLLTSKLRAKIHLEAEKYNQIKKSPKLPQ